MSTLLSKEQASILKNILIAIGSILLLPVLPTFLKLISVFYVFKLCISLDYYIRHMTEKENK